MLVLSLLGFLYQASEIVQEYLEHRSAVDLRIEGSGTLLYPGLSYCLTNWYVKPASGTHGSRTLVIVFLKPKLPYRPSHLGHSYLNTPTKH
ncbi:hypothetical protein HPB49_004290 [Dermacentor silvarum]|uniref:Uncharacterized protein n=1 Tax=Dermacentor silvarum TaxID=543639 RepID=A0ACB8D2V0_DERSI|nr:hypothetical protein HPB49_004290 [Dermacentor silvarum]